MSERKPELGQPFVVVNGQRCTPTATDTQPLPPIYYVPHAATPKKQEGAET